LAASAFVRILVINLFIPGHWGFLSQQAVTVALCAGLFYCCSRRKSGSDVLHAAYVPATYSWAGSVLLGLLVWYELRPVSVAVGWGVLGLILFEIGIVRRRSYEYDKRARRLSDFVTDSIAKISRAAPIP
jgi:hypothetical protein